METLTIGREKFALLPESIRLAIKNSLANGDFLYFAQMYENLLCAAGRHNQHAMKTQSIILQLTLFLTLIPACMLGQVKCGDEMTGEYLPLLRNKNIAVVANPSSMVGKVHLVDTLLSLGVKVSLIFCPEHGFRHFSEAGETVPNTVDSATKIPVISLYGKKKKPAKTDLEDIDLVLFDLQDVGVRFYTYISTLTYVMEACSESNIPMILLDRPNPNGFYIDGPVMEEAFVSFVGLHPVPIVYGMTIGEYAQMVNGEGWLKNHVICELQVIHLREYAHSARCMLSLSPSPNLRNMNAVYLYPSLCLFEGTKMSVGRGTDLPFEIFGSPEMKGFSFSFVPESRIKGVNPLYKGQLCRGLDLRTFYSTHPKLMGRLNLSWLLMGFIDMRSQPDFFNDYFEKLAGTASLRAQIIGNKPESEIRQSWQEGLDRFKEIRKKYLIYPE